jgi:hypothetical protein
MYDEAVGFNRNCIYIHHFVKLQHLHTPSCVFNTIYFPNSKFSTLHLGHT